MQTKYLFFFGLHSVQTSKLIQQRIGNEKKRNDEFCRRVEDNNYCRTQRMEDYAKYCKQEAHLLCKGTQAKCSIERNTYNLLPKSELMSLNF